MKEIRDTEKELDDSIKDGGRRMKIVRKEAETIEFKNIAIGNIFQSDVSGVFYMRTKLLTDSNGLAICNAVSLEDGTHTYFDDQMDVRIVKGQVMIE